MRNLRLILSYDGSEFAGWQVQPDRATVQGTLASAIGRLTGENVLPQGSGRTDAGVHALAQVASSCDRLASDSAIPAQNLGASALNDLLPARRSACWQRARPRRRTSTRGSSARAKTYRYRLVPRERFARRSWPGTSGTIPFPLR